MIQTKSINNSSKIITKNQLRQLTTVRLNEETQGNQHRSCTNMKQKKRRKKDKSQKNPRDPENTHVIFNAETVKTNIGQMNPNISQ